MPATLLDLSRPATAAAEIADVNRRLSRAAETPADVLRFVEDIAGAIASTDDLAAVNPWLWIRLQAAALRAQVALRDGEPERRRSLRLALEEIRFLLARIAEREPIGEHRPAGEVASWLDEALPSVSQREKADLLGVSLRTYQRWVAGETTPAGRDERRLRVVARLVNQLRHSLTGPGVLDWFRHPRADLDGAAPADTLDDPDRLEPLIGAAAASRGQVAA
jgi:transcriptional regulator with XRE-family HTH domain